MFKNLFGLPVYKSKINPDIYNKKEIIDTITENYLKDKTRNSWDSLSSLHHSNNDEENKNFKEINYQDLLPIYNKEISKFLDSMSLLRYTKFSYNVSNYTCMENSNYMKSHYHNDCDFNLVHYIKFNKTQHIPTLYENTHSFSNYCRDLRPNLKNVLDSSSENNSWYYSNYCVEVNEDDFVITPAFLFHSVPLQKNVTETRMTIVLNILLS